MTRRGGGREEDKRTRSQFLQSLPLLPRFHFFTLYFHFNALSTGIYVAWWVEDEEEEARGGGYPLNCLRYAHCGGGSRRRRRPSRNTVRVDFN